MAKRGRPRVLDDIKRREVCALISAGCGMEAAARYVGCSPRTIRREALRNVEFHQRLRKAEVGVELKPLEEIRTAAQSQWRAAAWLLERTNPERFARRDTNLVRPKDVTKLLEEFVETFVNEIAELPNCKA